jgi:purine catabolism regulator
LETIISGELRAKTIRAHARAREDEVVVFVALDPARGIDAARKLAERIDKQTYSEFPQARLATGIGRTVPDLLALRGSYRQALQARTMGARLAEPHPLYFGDLSVYRLLFQLEHSPELESFCNEILGTLIEYDHAQKVNLVETLTAYFAHHENLTQTARTLHLHRNSLLYRIARIQEITHWDLANPETRLAVQLALRAFRMLAPHNK